MAHENLLMRMLEPAVRPTGAPAPRATPRIPLERQDFDALLADAGQLAFKQAAEAGPFPPTDGPQAVSGAMPGESATASIEADESLKALQLMRRLGSIANISNRGVLSVLPAAPGEAAADSGRPAPVD